MIKKDTYGLYIKLEQPTEIKSNNYKINSLVMYTAAHAPANYYDFSYSTLAFL